MTEANETPAAPANVAATPARVFALLQALQLAQEVVRVREAAEARAAERERIDGVIWRNNEELRRLVDQAGPGAATAATARERLLLGRLNTKIHFSLTQALSALNGAREADAQKYLVEYDRWYAMSHWIWGILADRVKNGTENRALTDYFTLPGEVSTVVEETDAQGKPVRLSRCAEMP